MQVLITDYQFVDNSFQYSLSLLIFFLLEMAVAVVGFVFPHAMQATLEESFTDRIIHYYRDDADLQNFIDFAQQEVMIYSKVYYYLEMIIEINFM